MWLIVLPLDVPTLTTSRLPDRSWQSEVKLYIYIYIPLYTVPTFTTSRLVEILVVKGGTMWTRNGRWILPEMPDFHVAFKDLLHALNLRHGTDGFTSPPKEGVLRIFSPWTLWRLRPGLNLCTKGQHATSRPPTPPAEYDTVNLSHKLPVCTFFFPVKSLSTNKAEHQTRYKLCSQ
jgi:hypothetical protein